MKPNYRAASYGLEALLLIAILALAAFVRLENLTDNPGWYSDEGTHLEIAKHYTEGRTQYMAFDQSVLLWAKMPLFPWLTSRWLLLTNTTPPDSITVVRTFSAVLATLSVGLLWWVVRRTQRGQERALPLMAAAVLAIYPTAVIYNRIGFSYNLAAPLLLLLFWALWEYLEAPRRSWLAFAALLVGISVVVDLFMLVLFVPLVLVISVRRWHDALWAVPLGLVPFGIYAVAHLLAHADVFLYDLEFTFGRIGGMPLYMQIPAVLLNHVAVILIDPWILLATIGMFFIPGSRQQRLFMLMFLAPLLSLERSTVVGFLSQYYLIPIMPLIAWGVAALVRFMVPVMVEKISDAFRTLFGNWTWWPRRPLWVNLQTRLIAVGTMPLVFLLALAPLFYFAALNIRLVGNTLKTDITAVMLDPDDSRRVATYLNARTMPDDVLITSPAIAWLFEAQVADFQMAVTAMGNSTEHLPGDIPADRFLFDVRYTQADYVIVDNLWRNWAAVNMEEVEDMMRDVQENWVPVYIAGEINVYRNPDRPVTARENSLISIMMSFSSRLIPFTY
jgi:4-amino-4-deoxy-L-arabinose transferase-like glycosyltransferase